MSENVQLRRATTDLKAESEQQKKATNDLTTEADKLRMNLKKITTQFNQRQEDINKLIQNNKVMDQEIKDQTSYIEKIHAANDRMTAENSQLKKLQEDCMKENAQLWEQNKGLKSQLNEARGVVEELNNEIQINKGHLDSLMPENENLRHYADDIKQKLEQTIDDNKKLIQDQDVIRAQESIKLQSSMDESKRLKDEIIKYKKENEKLKVLKIIIIGGNKLNY